MARPSLRRPENADGPLFVDSTCIDCDTCRWVAPRTFERVGDASAVVRQPRTPGEERRAMMALVACPTSSIGGGAGALVREARGAFPDPVTDRVLHCGYHDERSFGAASWLVLRPEGNVLVDVPRFAGPLVKRIEELGGVRTLFLTHRDDMAGHERFAAHFGCERVLSRADWGPRLGTVERLVEGEEPVSLAPDLLVIPVPGHTRGSCCLLFTDSGTGERTLFAGDHLSYSPRLGHLRASPSVCWFDWGSQIASMKRLREHAFERVLPGHGRARVLPAAAMRRELELCIAWMEGHPAGGRG